MASTSSTATDTDPHAPPATDPGPAPEPSRGREVYWAVWATAAAFGTYFCMYGFRKPFTAASYTGPGGFGLGLKSLLVTAQVTGYMISKFVGIKVIAETPPHRRALGILGLIGAAEASLVLFGLVPTPWSALFMVANGLALGMVFGLVLGYLEGRRHTEALAAGLCASFILADGVMKTVGSWLLSLGVTESWMPAAAGGGFLLPLGLCTWMLSRIPAPDARDVAARAERHRLDAADRWSLFSRHAFGLSLLVAMYLLVTILRSLRADFAPEIWRGLGRPAAPETFTQSELIVALGVLAANGCAVLVRDNRRAFFAALGTAAFGFVMIMAALLARQAGRLDPFAFMVAIGLGLYLPYVAVHTTIFERLLAMTRERGNTGYLMYVADSIGYLGYVAVMLLKGSTSFEDVIGFFLPACWL
ncbi:MAG: DUF5690 family protein, partial [Isosphaeraceae bacterium]